MTNCLHCVVRPATASRGLCRRCYSSPARVLYLADPRSVKAAEAVEDTTINNAPAPREPTDALPGSPEKVRVLEQRFACGESLWHPQDAKYDR